jgi:Bacterial Ig-like domain/FG-GAP-like repeat
MPMVLLAFVAACGGGGGGGASQPPPSVPLRVAASSVDRVIDVDPAEPIVVTFDAPLAPGVVASQVQLSDGSAAVPFAVETSGSGLVIRPTERLRLRTDYRLTVKAGVQALNGAVLPGDHVLSFRTMPILLQSKALLPQSADISVGNVGGGDVNADGRTDVVLISRYSVGLQQGLSLRVYTQGVDGSLTLFQLLDHLVTTQPYAVNLGKPVVLDVDGDGVTEILVTQEVFGQDDATGLLVFKRGGDGLFRAEPLRQNRYLQSALLADVNGDGRPDLVGRFYRYGATSGFQVFLNTSAGLQELAPVELPAGQSAYQLALADLDRDGSAEVVVVETPAVQDPALPFFARRIVYTRQSGSYVQSNALSGLLQGVCATDPLGCEKPRFIDIDGDGWLDLLLVSGRELIAYLRQPNGGFAAGFRVTLGEGVRVLQVADLDGDGMQDFLAFTNTFFNYVVAGLAQRRPTFEYSRVFDLPALSVSPISEDAITVVDFNGDGRPDVLVASAEGLILMQQAR